MASASDAFPDPLPGETEPYALWGTVRALPGQGEALGERLLALVGPSRAEAGALAYHVHRDREDPDLFALYEAWTDAEAFRAHVATPHVQAFLSDWEDFSEGEFKTRFVRMISPPAAKAS